MRLLAYIFGVLLFAFAAGAVSLVALLVAACVGPAVRTVHPHINDEA